MFELALSTLNGADILPAGHGKAAGRIHYLHGGATSTESCIEEIKDIIAENPNVKLTASWLHTHCGYGHQVAGVACKKLVEEGLLKPIKSKEWNQNRTAYIAA